MLRRVTSEASFKISNFFKYNLEGFPSSLRRCQNNLSSLRGGGCFNFFGGFRGKLPLRRVAKELS